MELFSINSSYSVNSTTAVNLDHSPEAWTVAVPVIFVLICTGVTVTIVILLFLFWYKKVHRRGVVAPAPGTNTISNGGPTSNVSKTISNRGQVPPNGFRRVSNGGPVQGSVRKPSKSEFLKKSSFNTTVSFDDDEGDPLAVTRTQSLTVLVPVGGSCSSICWVLSNGCLLAVIVTISTACWVLSMFANNEPVFYITIEPL